MINPDMFMVISECWITNVRLENYRLILLAHSHFTCIFPRDGRNSLSYIFCKQYQQPYGI